MALDGNYVVGCGVRYSVRAHKYHARVSVQTVTAGVSHYERHKATFGTWAEVAAWFATFG